MTLRAVILLTAASTAAAQVSFGPACAAVVIPAAVLSANDEGLRYCSSILSIGTVIDPIYSTVTSALAVTRVEDALTVTGVATVLAEALTSYLTTTAVTITRTSTVG